MNHEICACKIKRAAEYSHDQFYVKISKVLIVIYLVTSR